MTERLFAGEKTSTIFSTWSFREVPTDVYKRQSLPILSRNPGAVKDKAIIRGTKFLDNMGNDAKFLLYFLRLIILVIWFSYYLLLYKGKNGIKGIASIMMLFLGEFYSLITGNNQEFLSVYLCHFLYIY